MICPDTLDVTSTTRPVTVILPDGVRQLNSAVARINVPIRTTIVPGSQPHRTTLNFANIAQIATT